MLSRGLGVVRDKICVFAFGVFMSKIFYFIIRRMSSFKKKYGGSSRHARFFFSHLFKPHDASSISNSDYFR